MGYPATVIITSEATMATNSLRVFLRDIPPSAIRSGIANLGDMNCGGVGSETLPRCGARRKEQPQTYGCHMGVR